MAFGGNPTVLGSGLPIASGGSTVVSGPGSSTDNAIARWNGTGGNLIQNSVNILSDNGVLTVPSTATEGVQLYNTADQTTNYERLEALWSGNLATIQTIRGGSGTKRSMRLGVNGEGQLNLNTATPFIQILGSSGSATNTTQVNLGSTGTLTATSGTTIVASITPTYNQASGTAANTDCLVNRTETAVGSGTQNLLDLQVGGTSRFAVRNTGAVVMANQTTGPGAGLGTLTNAPSAGDPDFWLPITINGTAHWIPAWAA